MRMPVSELLLHAPSYRHAQSAREQETDRNQCWEIARNFPCNKRISRRCSQETPLRKRDRPITRLRLKAFGAPSASNDIQGRVLDID